MNSNSSPNDGQRKTRRLSRGDRLINWMADADVNGTDKLVMLALSRHVGWNSEQDDGTFLVWPGKTTIARKAGLGRTAVYGSLKRLTELGYVETCVRRKNHEGRESHQYILKKVPPAEVLCSPREQSCSPDEHPCSPNEHEGGAVKGEHLGEIDEKANPTDLLLPPALDSDSSPEKEKKEKGAAAVPVQSIARWQEAGEIVAKYEKNVMAHPNSRIGVYFALGRHFYPAARKFKAGKALTSGQLKQLHGLFESYGDRACQLLAMMFVEWRDLIPKWSDKANPDFGMLDFEKMNQTFLVRESPDGPTPIASTPGKLQCPTSPKALPKVPMTSGIEWMAEPNEEAA